MHRCQTPQTVRFSEDVLEHLLLSDEKIVEQCTCIGQVCDALQSMYPQQWKHKGGTFCLNVFMAFLPFALKDCALFGPLRTSVSRGVTKCFSRRQLYAVSESLMNLVDQIYKYDYYAEYLLVFCFTFLEKCRKTPGYRRLLDHVMDCVMRISTPCNRTCIWYLAMEFGSIIVDDHFDRVHQWARQLLFSRNLKNARFALEHNDTHPCLRVSEDDLLMLVRSNDEYTARIADSLLSKLPVKTHAERRERGDMLESQRQTAALFLFYQQCTVYDIPLGKHADCVRLFLGNPLLPFHLKMHAVCVIAGSLPPTKDVFEDVQCIYPFLR